MQLTLIISPKTFNVEVEEYVYNTLEEVLDNKPNKVDLGQVNNMNTQGQRYNEIATVEFVRKAADRHLSKIELINNDNSDKIVIVIKGDDYRVYKNSVDDANLVSLADYGYSIEMGDRVKLTYITQNNISFRLEYKDLKVISAG